MVSLHSASASLRKDKRDTRRETDSNMKNITNKVKKRKMMIGVGRIRA